VRKKMGKSENWRRRAKYENGRGGRGGEERR
jgi:hypothetical protein